MSEGDAQPSSGPVVVSYPTSMLELQAGLTGRQAEAHEVRTYKYARRSQCHRSVEADRSQDARSFLQEGQR